jgi:hypothetical protein
LDVLAFFANTKYDFNFVVEIFGEFRVIHRLIVFYQSSVWLDKDNRLVRLFVLQLPDMGCIIPPHTENFHKRWGKNISMFGHLKFYFCPLPINYPMMQWKSALLGSTLLILSLFGCVYNTREAAKPVETNTCDTTIKYNYDSVVVVMTRQGCLDCHIEGGNSPNLESKTLLTNFIRSNETRFLKAVRFEGASPMPKGGTKMPDADLAVLEKWICQGMK